MLRANASTDNTGGTQTATGVSNKEAKKTEKKEEAKTSLRKAPEKSGEPSVPSLHTGQLSTETIKLSSRTQAESVVATAVGGSAEGSRNISPKRVGSAELQQRMSPQPAGGSNRPVEVDTRHMNMFQKMLAERNQAKKEEGEYLKIRKQQLLKDLLPKTKGARLRRSDEKFPSHQLKAMEKWNFGAMKAKYMSIRPSGKYATWFGKKHDEKHKHEKCITIKERVLTARRATSPDQHNQKKSKTSKTAKASIPKNISLPKEPPPLQEESAMTPEDLWDEDCMTNTRYSRPFNEKGVLFWLEGTDNLDTEDEETIVNLDSVVKDGELAQKQQNRHGPLRKSIAVNMANPLETLVKLDKMYEQSNVYFNTIACVINLTPVEEKKGELPGKKTQRKVVFKEKMLMSEYPADGGGSTAKATTETRPLRDVVKTADKE